MAKLSLDTIEVDTNLAEEYLKKYNNFNDWPLPEKIWYIEDYPAKKVEYIERKDIRQRDKKPVNTKGAYLGRKLAKKIEENELLFCQLEYLIRKTNVLDVKNNIKLISQQLQCSAALWNVNCAGTTLPRAPLRLLINETSPLYTLGYVAIALYLPKQEAINIITTQKMAPICHLFTQLCAEVGWEIPLIFPHDIEVFKSLEDNDESEELWCTGVVTESADIDSALDHFIHSSVKAPWKLKRVYVQESVYSEVKGALAWKCSRERVDSCVDAFAINDKMFLCDSLSKGDGGVRVEAYRTAKELCGLLAQHSSPTLSVWATDAALAHEIAFTAPSSRVWINDYATFDGPPLASVPIYTKLYPDIPCRIFDSDKENLKKLSKPWNKMSRSDRIDVIVKTLHQVSSASSQLDLVDKLQDWLLDWRNYSFVSVTDGRICFGVEEAPLPENIDFVDVANDNSVIDIIKATVNGSAVLYNLLSDSDVEKFKIVLDSLEESGVPALQQMGSKPESSKLINVPVITTKLKVVCTNFGTIFAN